MSSLDKDHLPEPTDLSLSQPGLRLLRAAWKHKTLLLLGLVVGVVGGVLYHLQKQPVYQSSTQLMVIKKNPERRMPQGLEGLQPLPDDYVSSHVSLLKSPLIVERAVREHGLEGLPSLAGKKDPVGLVLSGLTVTTPSGSGASSSPIINLSYRSTSPADCQLVLNAIVTSYKQFLDEKYQNVNKETVNLITSATKALREDKVKHEAAYKQLRAAAPDFIRTKDGGLAKLDLLCRIDDRRSVLVLRRIELDTRKSNIEHNLEQKKDLSVIAALMVERNDSVAASNELRTKLRARLAELQVEQRRLSDRFGRAHPELIDLETQMKALQAVLDQLAKEEPSLGNPRQRARVTRQQVDDYIATLRQSLQLIDKELDTLNKLYKHEFTEFRKLAEYLEEEEKSHNAIVATDQLLAHLEKPLREIDLVKDYGGYTVESLAPPGGGGKVEPRALTVFPLAAFAGLLLGGMLAWLAEVSDRSFRSPQDIRQRLGLPILGHVPHFDLADTPVAELADLALSLCAAHKPKSSDAEAFREIRTALYYSTHGDGHQVIQVTSPSMGDGKTTLCANLAVSIAQAGKSVLLIDADFRRPRLHRLFNLTPGCGIASVLSGAGQVAAAIRKTLVLNLEVLPCGPRPSNPADLLSAPQFNQLLETLRSRYDFIIIDTPPLLAVSDPTIVAPSVDGVVLALRLTRTGRPAAERAKELLASVGATILGVVVNGFEKKGLQSYGGDYADGYSYRYYANYEPDGDSELSANLLNGVNGKVMADVSSSDEAVDFGAPQHPLAGRTRAARRAPPKKRHKLFGWLRFWQ